MKISRPESKRAYDLLKYYINAKEPGTLYRISHEKKLMARATLDLAVENLLKRNLIKEDPEKLRQTGRKATIYIPTFKGLLMFLKSFEFPEGCNSEPTVKRDESRVVPKDQTKQCKELEKVLERNGRRLNYPIFKHARSFNLDTRLYQALVSIAKEILPSPFQQQPYSLELFEEIEKSRVEINELKKELTEYDQDYVLREHIQRKERESNDNQQSIDAISERENEAFKEKFFLKFLRFLERAPEIKIPNEELYAYTEDLIQKRERELEYLRNKLGKDLGNFRT